MSRKTLRGPEAADEILRLCHGYLPWHRSLTLGLSTDPAVYPEARTAHAAHLPADEPLIAVYDGTLFGGAGLGLLLTPERVCWKRRGGRALMLTWDELDPALLGAGDGELRIGDASIPLPDELCPDMLELLSEIARRRHGKDQNPYRDRPPEPDEAEGAPKSVDDLVVLLWKQLGPLGGVRYHPRIPRASLDRFRAQHAAHLPEDEELALLYEARGTEAMGLGISRERLYWSLSDRKVRFNSWKNLEPHTIKSNDAGGVTIMGVAVPLPAEASAEKVAELFRLLVHQAGGEDLAPIEFPHPPSYPP
jgi:hypothetical protein